MKKSKLRELVKTKLRELSATGTGASFTPGVGMQTATPKTFKKKNNIE